MGEWAELCKIRGYGRPGIIQLPASGDKLRFLVRTRVSQWQNSGLIVIAKQ